MVVVLLKIFLNSILGILFVVVIVFDGGGVHGVHGVHDVHGIHICSRFFHQVNILKAPTKNCIEYVVLLHWLA